MSRFTMLAVVLVCGWQIAIAAELPLVPEVLGVALRKHYPAVERWEVRPLHAVDGTILAGSVIQLGARSAIRNSLGVVQWFEVRGWAPGMRAARGVPPQQVLSSNDLQSGQADLLSSGCQVLLQSLPAGAWSLRTGLSAGQPICQEELREAPAVRRGASVRMLWQTGSIGIEARAIALADGKPGQQVPVRIAGSSRHLQTIVSGVDEVHYPPLE